MESVLWMLDLILSETTSCFTFAATLVFLHCFYDPGFQWHKKKAIWLLVVSVTVTAALIVDSFHRLHNVLFYSIVAIEPISRFILVIYDYKGKRSKGLLRYLGMAFIIGFCMGLITDNGSQYLFRNYDSDNLFLSLSQSIPVYILCGLFFSGVYFYLYNKVYKPGITFPWTKRERTFVIGYLLACLLYALIIEIFGKQSHPAYVLMGLAYVLLMILVPLFFYYLLISRHFQKQTRVQEAYIQAELAHFRQYKQTQEETARFRHDTRNNLLCLNDLLGTGKVQEATEYLQSLLQVTETLRAKYVSGDEILDSILAVKADVMEQNEIRFHFDGVLAGGLGWNAVDVCGVFANALDNAIEASMRLPPLYRKITLEIKSTAQFRMIRLSNYVLENVDTEKLFQQLGGYTTKTEGLHGIGTYNMKRTVESYGGMIHARCADNLFTLEIMIDKGGL